MYKKISYEDIGFNSIFYASVDSTRLKIPVGISETGTIINLNFDCNFIYKSEAISSYYIFGGNGSGKSSLLLSVLFNGCYMYKPEDLRFQIFNANKYPTEYDYPLMIQLPHVDKILFANRTNGSYEFWQSLADEGFKRMKLFESTSKKIQKTILNIVEYNNCMRKYSDKNNTLPRIIVLADNLQYLIGDIKQYKSEDCALLNNICFTFQFAKYGIHIVCTSTPGMYNDFICRIPENKIFGLITNGICLKANHCNLYLHDTYFKDVFTDELMESLSYGEGYLSTNWAFKITEKEDIHLSSNDKSYIDKCRQGQKFNYAFHDNKINKYIDKIIRKYNMLKKY